jgi:hypothetical protein
MLERRLGLAEARYVLALAEALPRSPDAVALLLRRYCGRRPYRAPHCLGDGSEHRPCARAGVDGCGGIRWGPRRAVASS